MSDNPSSSESTRYHHGNLRRALLESGLGVLETGGEQDLSLRDLARRIGVTPTAVYRHFASKEQLLIALAVEGFKQLTEAQIAAYATACRDDVTEFDAFQAAGLAYVKFASAHPGLFRLMFGRFAKSYREDAEFARASKTNVQTTTAAVRRMLGEQASEMDQLASGIGAWSLVHGLSFLFIDGQLEHINLDRETLAKASIDYAMRGLHVVEAKNNPSTS